MSNNVPRPTQQAHQGLPITDSELHSKCFKPDDVAGMNSYLVDKIIINVVGDIPGVIFIIARQKKEKSIIAIPGQN